MGSVLLFDYSGYGYSEGVADEKNLYENILSVWSYAVEELKYDPQNIIIYGCSLGCSVGLWLGQSLVEKNDKLPKLIIAQSGFQSLKRMTESLIGCLKYLLMYDFDNDTYIKNIRGKIPIILLHSKDDELIDISHPVNLSENIGCHFCEISGCHNGPIFNEKVTSLIDMCLNK